MLTEGIGHLTYGQRQHLFYDEPRPFSNHLLRSVKVFDGLFIANYHAGREEEFLFNNKIRLIINCSPHEFPITKSSLLHVLSYNFLKKNGQLQQFLNIVLIMQIIVSMEYFLNEKLQGVIILSKNIGSKVTTLLIVYLMIKFNWNLDQTLKFVEEKKEELTIGEKYMKLLQRFEKNKDKNKLTQVFLTNNTEQDQQLLKNTVKNAQIKNLPNFFGLNHLKTIQGEFNSSIKPRKVKFLDKVQYIGNGKILSQSKIAKSSLKFENILERSMNSEIESKKAESNLSIVEKKLKKYINQKNINEQNSDEKGLRAKKDEKQQIMIIKNKEIIRRMPRRRAKSKTQESIQHGRKETSEIIVKNNNFLSKFINIEDNDRSPERQSSFVNRVEVNQKVKRLSEAKKIKVKTRFYTEQTVNESNLNDQFLNKKEESKIVAINNIFKISKSNKSSYKKIKQSNFQNKVKSNSSKTSDKCINYFSNEMQKTLQKVMSKPLTQHKVPIGIMKYKDLPKYSNININFQYSQISIPYDNNEQEINLKEQIRDKYIRKFNMKKSTKKSSYDEIK